MTKTKGNVVHISIVRDLLDFGQCTYHKFGMLNPITRFLKLLIKTDKAFSRKNFRPLWNFSLSNHSGGLSGTFKSHGTLIPLANSFKRAVIFVQGLLRSNDITFLIVIVLIFSLLCFCSSCIRLWQKQLILLVAGKLVKYESICLCT